MKIVKRIDFLKFAAGTVFTAYEPCFFGPLKIKGDTINLEGKDVDFYAFNIADAVSARNSVDFSDILDRCKEIGESFDMDLYCQGRDGMFEPDDRLYAVWERKDVEQLIERLLITINTGPGHE